MNRSTPGLPVHHKLPEFTQTHAHWVGDAIQPSYPLSSPSPPAPNPSQHQGLFQWVNSSHEVAKVLEFQLHHQSFQWTPRTDLLQDGLVGSPCSILKPRDITLPTKVHLVKTGFPSSHVWMWVKGEVIQLCLTLCDPMSFTIHGILHARILEWVTFPFSRGSSQPRDQTQVSHIAGGFLIS